MAFNAFEKKSLFGLALVTALRTLGFSLVLPIFVLYGNQFTDSPLLIGIALGAYGITQAVFQVPFGMLSDRWGRKPLLLFGLFLFGLGSVLGIAPQAVSQDLFNSPDKAIYILILCRLLQGTGAVTAVIFAFVADIIPAEKRNSGMVWIGMPIGIAISLGIILGPILGARYGFGSLFILTTGLVVAAFIYCLFFLKEAPGHHHHHRDVELDSGSVLLILKNARLLKLNFCGFITDFLMTSLFFALPFIMRDYLEVKRFWIIYAPMLVIGIGMMFIGSRQADKGYTRSVFISAYLAMGAGFIFMSMTGLVWLLIGTLLVYSGVSVLHPIMPTTVTKMVAREFMGTATGVFNFFLYFGAFAGGTGAGLISQKWEISGLLHLMTVLAFISAVVIGTVTDFQCIN